MDSAVVEGENRDEPLPSFRFAKCQSPFLSPGGRGGTNPLSLAALDSSPEGRALGKKGNSRPYRSTARRSQLISTKLYASAKASPFRERWHGGAVTERVAYRTNPLSRLRRQLVSLFVAWRRHLPPAGGSLSTQVEALAEPAGFVLTRQRLCLLYTSPSPRD